MRLMLDKFAAFVLMSAVLLSSASFASAFPEEGMFTPDQINKLPLAAKGMKIKPSELYNTNGAADIADAIVRVNIGENSGFGTGEFVSPNGLILTNHHVGFDALVAASTPENDYAKNGYKADSQTTELPAKNYSILMTFRVEDVSAKVKKGTENLTGDALKAALKKNAEDLQSQEQSKLTNGATIRIQSLNSDYFYYLYETMILRDIRVVYAPTKNIGFFGGDPDNFEWSRHTGDFTFLRAYVGPDGKPAPYSTANVPFKPKRFLTISLNGVKENEFVMVMGHPGGTTRYRESQAVKYAQEVNFPFIVELYSAWIKGLEQAGEDDEAKRIKLQSDIFSFNNTVKAVGGGVVAMKRADIVGQKQAKERKFAAWVAGNPARQTKYGTVLSDLQSLSDEYYRTGKRDRLLRSFPNPGVTPVFQEVYNAILAVQAKKPIPATKAAQLDAIYKNREPIVEREVLKFFFKAAAELPADQTYQPIESLFNRFQGKERRSAEETVAESIAEKDFDTAQKVIALYDMSFNDIQKKYPNIVSLVTAMDQEKTAITARAKKFNDAIDALRLIYQQGMSEMEKSNPYPDANGTLRFTYGAVKGYNPREAVTYKPFTTLKGVLEKDSGIEPFDVPQELKDLQQSRDFGRYGVGDSVPVNFLATTDIIGGNSGSPIMNAYGEQIGIVFDGNYEGLGNDIFFDGNYGRTIAVDIRYVLFVTEKVGGAGWILEEMKIKGGAPAKAKRASAE